MTTPYKPTSFTSELISRDKLEQLSNNNQWLFENTPRMRYSVSGLTRDTGLKLLAGKTPYGQTTWNGVYQAIHFGNFFTVNCKPVVVASIEQSHGSGHRNKIVLWGLTGGEIDHTGFLTVITTEAERTTGLPGMIHWMALGY